MDDHEMVGPTPIRTAEQDAEYQAHDAKAKAGVLPITLEWIGLMRELQRSAERFEARGATLEDGEPAWHAKEAMLTQLMTHRIALIDAAGQCIAVRRK